MCQEGNITSIPSEKHPIKMTVTKKHLIIKWHAYRINQGYPRTVGKILKRFLRLPFFCGGTIFSTDLFFSTSIRNVWWNC